MSIKLSFAWIIISTAIPWENIFSRAFINNIHSKATKKSTCFHKSNPVDTTEITPFTEDVVESLDLQPLFERITRHCGTARGKRAIMALISRDENQKKSKHESQSSIIRSRRKWAAGYSSRGSKQGNILQLTLPRTADEARREYELIGQAMVVLDDKEHNTSFPPIYGESSDPFDVKTSADTDYDEWIGASIDDWTLETIVQAEQNIKMLIDLYYWANRETISYWAPFLADIARSIDIHALESLFREISGTVEINRVRSITDPQARSTYAFMLNGKTYPVLRVLREKRDELRQKKSKSHDGAVQDLEDEINSKEQQITEGLFLTLSNGQSVIDKSLNTAALLDTIFSRAAYGISIGGIVPKILRDGQISVDDFVHPLLLENSKAKAVPIDLRLSSDEGQRALIISGINGGGKTLAMKSFGLACALVKIGIPIPTTRHSGNYRPRVDFFDEILSTVGDLQSIEEGQSTFMAQVNRYGALIDTVCKAEDSTSSDRFFLILFDELGSGTEENAGGAIAQAVLEKLLKNYTCRIVATTHSPRLKTLSYKSNEFGCATVLLKRGESNAYQQPVFQLQYGVIGDSYPLSAASRSTPPLPEDVLQRASSLIVNEQQGSDISGQYIQILTKSLEKQVELATNSTKESERILKNTARCQAAMLTLGSAYNTHLERLEVRLNEYYQTLKKDRNSFELLGETLSELRLVRAKIKKQETLLREKGLRPLSEYAELQHGESVVVIDGDEYNGVSGTVTTLFTDRDLGPDDVAVFLASDPWDEALERHSSPQIFKRYQLAGWDYESVWRESDDYQATSYSIPDSKRRLNEILATIKTEDKSTSNRVTKSSIPQTTNAFPSSRARKAAKQKKKK